MRRFGGYFECSQLRIPQQKARCQDTLLTMSSCIRIGSCSMSRIGAAIRANARSFKERISTAKAFSLLAIRSVLGACSHGLRESASMWAWLMMSPTMRTSDSARIGAEANGMMTLCIVCPYCHRENSGQGLNRFWASPATGWIHVHVPCLSCAAPTLGGSEYR